MFAWLSLRGGVKSGHLKFFQGGGEGNLKFFQGGDRDTCGRLKNAIFSRGSKMLKKVIIMGLLLKKIFGARSAPKIFFFDQNFFSKGYFPRTNSGGVLSLSGQILPFRGGDNPVFSQGGGQGH